jgi:cellulase
MAMLGMASGHIIMQAVGVNGKDYEQGYGIYMPSDNSFINDVTSDSLACNGSPVSGFKSSSEVIPVKAGDTVTGNWLHTLTSTGADGSADNKVIDSSHKGPVMAYMKKVDDATQNPSAGPGDGWFKIAEAGLISSSQWAVDALIEAGGVQTVTIPSCIEDGDYLLRFELIALHDGTKPNGAQFYVSDTRLLLDYHPVLTHGSTDGMRPDLGLWRYRWKHTGDSFDPRRVLRKSALSPRCYQY